MTTSPVPANLRPPKAASVWARPFLIVEVALVSFTSGAIMAFAAIGLALS